MSDLSGKQLNAICYLLQGWKVGDVARQVKVNERTLTRWLNEPVFTGELSRQESQVIGAVAWRLVSLARLAVDTLQDILESDSPQRGANIKRLAAVSVLELLLKWKELQDFESRLTALEGKVK